MAKLPGSKYLNGILFGSGEVAAMFASQYLMDNFMDMTAFRIVYTAGLISYLMLILFSQYNSVVYLANVLQIMSIGGWFNTALLIIELRVPHANVGSVSALTRTFAVGSSVLAPTVSNLPAPLPQVFLMSLATFAFLLTFLLPPPGLNLPTVQKNSETSAILMDK